MATAQDASTLLLGSSTKKCRRHLSPGELEREVARLPECSRPDLLDRWERLYGCKPPVKISRNLLIRSIAYRMQENAVGGLPPLIKRRLLRLAEEVRLHGDAAITGMPRIKPGTRFVREWQGTLHLVTVTGSGFEWQGTVHRSLSETARPITGTRWNGWTFFKARRRTKGRAEEEGAGSGKFAARDKKRPAARSRADVEAAHV